MNAYLLVGQFPVGDEGEIDAIILTETPEKAALLAGGQLAGSAQHGGWLIAYRQELFHEPAPEERHGYIDDPEENTVFFIFRKGPITVLISPEEEVSYLRLIEIPLITE